jgi:hypothetical protein
MSTDVISLMDRYLHAKRDLAAAQIAKAQAEDAKEQAELEARRAEERALTASNESDGWRAFAYALTNEHLIDQYAGDELSDLKRDRVLDAIFYDHWSITGQLDGIPVEGLVNDSLEARA